MGFSLDIYTLLRLGFIPDPRSIGCAQGKVRGKVPRVAFFVLLFKMRP
jgi:hypothetical protein